MIIRTLFLLLATGLTPAIADVSDCTNCYQEGLDAHQRGELESALGFFERGCEQDVGAACNAASLMLFNGDGAPEDHTQALSFGLRSCDLGYWQGCRKLGVSLITSETPVAAAKGRELLARACDGGISSGCGYLGAALRDGLGGATDAVAANRYFQRACEGGSVAFCSELAAALAKGIGGLEVDIPRAAALFQTACDGGWSKACDNAELLAKARRKEPPKEQSAGWSTSVENFSFSTREDPAEEGGSQTLTTIGSMQIGQGSASVIFTDVRSSCGVLQLTLAFGSAAASARQCLGDSDTRRVMLVAEDGRIASSSVEPDDSVGRCVTSALGRAHIEGLSCRLEADVSR
jgi:TPR repeat protein